MDIKEILGKFEIFQKIHLPEIEAFKSEEDGSDYDVWKIVSENNKYVLKKAKEYEIEVYSTFFNESVKGAPKFYKSINIDGYDYFLMEYAEGNSLSRCDRKDLICAIDALISIQERYWEDRALSKSGFSFEASLTKRKNRGKYLNDAELEKAYATYLEIYSSVPRTLCHDDLLPFNVLVSDEGATIIDWEYAGILPYPSSLVRLIAHGTTNEKDLFYMKDEDKNFAIEYYYDKFIKRKGILYEDYRKAIDYFLLYEYCEWIMLGIKYGNTDSDRYRQYYKKAKEHLRKILKY